MLFTLHNVKLFSAHSVWGAQKSTECILLHYNNRALYDIVISGAHKLLTATAHTVTD
jgi:hypothetical protein